MKKTLFLVLSEQFNEAWWWDFPPADRGRIMDKIKVDVPDLPTTEEIEKFVIENRRMSPKQAEIAALKERLAKLEAE